MHHSVDDERLLVQRCVSGDTRAWDAFIDLHYGMISSVARWGKWSFDQHELDDITQDILEEVVKSLGSFEFRSQVSTFVYKIAVNTCVAHLRKKGAQKRIAGRNCIPLDTVLSGHDEENVSHVPADSCKNQEEILLEREHISLLKSGLDSLGKRCKELISARYFNELSFQDIASKLHEKENTLVVQLKRCLLRHLKFFQIEGPHGKVQ